jgi:hypothetical protein
MPIFLILLSSIMLEGVYAQPLLRSWEQIRSEMRAQTELQARAQAAIFAIERSRLDALKKSDFKGARQILVPKIAGTRFALRQEMVRAWQAGQLNEKTARTVYQAMRYLRGVEDYVGYIDSQQKVVDPHAVSQVNAILPVPGQYTQDQSLLPGGMTVFNPAVKDLRLKSGDVLLSRGSAATSSAIARLGDDDTQFSHMGLVYVDPQTRRVYTIEAHLEFGVVIAPIEAWLQDGKVRTVVYRFRDTELAAQGAARMHNEVIRYQREKGQNIPYDFGFNMFDASEIFCSEVVRRAFELASQGQVRVPMFPARLTPKNRGFLEQLGVFQTESFIPADIEMDPRFEWVAEWRNFGGMRDSWINDAITTKVYAWMEQDGWTYRPTTVQEIAGKGLVKLRHTRGVQKLLEKRIAPNANAEVVSVMLAIESLYSQVQKALKQREEIILKRRGIPFTLFEALNAMEDLRRENPRLFERVLK